MRTRVMRKVPRNVIHQGGYRMAMKFNALFTGSSTKDFIMVVDEPPVSDRRIAASEFVISFGGVATTAAVAHQKLGGSTALITIIGNDEIGETIRDDIMAQNFAWQQVLVTDQAHSSASCVLVEKNGNRLISKFGGCIHEMTFEKMDLSVLHQINILHLGMMDPELMLRLARYCKENTRALLSVDGGNLSRETTDELLPYTDIFIPDNKTAMRTLSLAPEEACRYYIKGGAGFAAVTSGEKGVVAFDGKEWYAVPALPVNVVDTLGAGDNFHGAFLYAMSQGWDMDKKLRFANVFASLTCEGLGGRSAIPPKDKVLEIMNAGSLINA